MRYCTSSFIFCHNYSFLLIDFYCNGCINTRLFVSGKLFFILKKVGGYRILLVPLHPIKNYTIVCGITKQ